MYPSTRRGFTLLELLVVVAIIGILSAVVLAMLNSSRIDGRDSKRIGDMKQISTALQFYYDKNLTYPPDLTSLVTQGFMGVLPKDPLGQTSYHYDQVGSGASFHLAASLERANNKAFASDRDSTSTNINGADTADCTGATNGRYCYDVVP